MIYQKGFLYVKSVRSVDVIYVVGTWQVILKDIGKGKIISSGAFYNSSKDKIVRVNENEAGNIVVI